MWKRLWEWTEFGQKSGWNWLELLSALAIPIVIAAAGYWFTSHQEERQLAIEAQRAESERKLEEQRWQQEALQAYFDEMKELMLNENLKGATEGDAVFTLARARTATVMTRLDAKRIRSVTRFLSDAGLNGTEGSSTSLLRGIDLRDLVLVNIELTGVDLGGADLRGANLKDAHLTGANLASAELLSADLSDADLRDANLRDAHLNGADLASAKLLSADLGDAHLGAARLEGADLSVADLGGADLSGADLGGARLVGSYLAGANFENADLEGADLENAKGLSKEALDQQVAALEGATMPDGSEFKAEDIEEDNILIQDPAEGLAVEVPPSWEAETGKVSEHGGGPNSWSYYAGELLTASITTAPSLDAWYVGEGSGAYIVASRELAQNYTDDELVHSLLFTGKPNECATGPYEDFHRAPYSGKIQTWYECGGNKATTFTVAAAPQGRECVVVFTMKSANEADREAIQHILDTFKVDCKSVSS